VSDDYKPGLVGQIKDKLITTKQQWAKEGRLLTGEASAPEKRRLPPGQRLVRDWPVLDLGVQPNILLDRWQLTVGGLVGNPVRLTWNDFLDLPQSDTVSDIHCVTAWSRYDNRWSGVKATDFLRLVKPHKDAKHVVFQSYDGYATNVGGRAADPRAWRASAHCYAAILFLEVGEMDQAHRLPRPRRSRLLGSARLPQYRRSLEGRPLRLGRQAGFHSISGSSG
jgi:hypothetical protein